MAKSSPIKAYVNRILVISETIREGHAKAVNIYVYNDPRKPATSGPHRPNRKKYGVEYKEIFSLLKRQKEAAVGRKRLVIGCRFH